MRLLAIDPGRKGLGWAMFEGSAGLVSCGVVPELKPLRAFSQPTLAAACYHAAEHLMVSTGLADLAVVERMRHYPGQAFSDAKANDLLDLQAIGAYVAGRRALSVAYLSPQEWKGSAPKPVMARRIRAALTPAELEILDRLKGAKAHNAIDAVGIGLHYLGRLKK